MTDPRPAQVRHWIGLGLILLLAAGLRTYRLAAPPLGVDELFSVHFATAHGPWEEALPPTGRVASPAPHLQSVATAGPITRIPDSLSRDTHPPLYAFALRLWMDAFGDGDAAARGLSVVLSLVGLLLLFDAVRHLSGPAAGLWAAAVYALAGPQIAAAQEVRGYVMLTALACAAAAAAARVVVRGATWGRCTAFAGVALAAMLTHYWAIAPLAAAGLFLLIELRRRDRWRLAACVAVAAVAFVGAWGPWLWQQRPYFSQNMQWIAAGDEPGHAMRTIRLAAVAPLRLLFEPGNALLEQVEAGASLAWLATGLALLLPVLGLKHNRGLRLWWLMLVPPIALVAIADITQQRKTMGLVRYFLPAGVGLYGAVAAGLAQSASAWRRHVLPSAAVLACLGALPMAWERTKPDWRTLAAETLRDATPDDLLILLVHPDGRWRGAVAYMAVCRYAGAPPCPLVVLDGPPPPDDPALRARIDGAQRLIVLSDALQPPIEEIFPAAAVERSGGVFGAGSWTVLRRR